VDCASADTEHPIAMANAAIWSFIFFIGFMFIDLSFWVYGEIRCAHH
jgi:hypothetical protein